MSHRAETTVVTHSPFLAPIEALNPMSAELSSGEAPVARRRAERRQAILEAAARLFATSGYAGCEMERLATELGIAKGTLYLYFPAKQELFFACVDWGMSQMQRTVRAAAERETDPFRRIACAIRAYLAFFEEHPEYVELLIQERAIFKDRKRPTYFEYRKVNLGYWHDQYRALIAAGRLRSDLPVERISDTMGSLVYGTMFTNHFVGRSVPLDEQSAVLLEIVFRGLMSEDERRLVPLLSGIGPQAESTAPPGDIHRVDPS
ncbi:MAG TPA: TetR/AcrR family transcriptional regulator [Planctomycetaceae bacterium]|nr:TetR/AcrR family transcriptional regulator [Planctomycetaceae bacterium]